MSKSVIDLGLYHHDPQAEPYEPGRPRHHARRWVVRWWRPGLVLAAVVGLLGGAAVPGEPLLVRAWTLPDVSVHWLETAGDSVYLVGQTEQAWALQAYRLSDGAPRWRVPFESPGERVNLMVADGVPLVIVVRPGGTELVTAYDPATGEVIWSRLGWPRATLTNGLVLLSRQVHSGWPADDGTRPGDGASAYHTSAVEVRSGAVAWTRRFPPGEQVLGERRLTHLLTLGEDGRLTRYDPATGAVQASASTPSGGSSSTPLGTLTRVLLGGGSLTVLPMGQAGGLADPDQVVLGDRGALVGYDLVSLAPRWRLELRRPWAVPCGPLVCAANVASSGGGIEGIDPVTGEVQWWHPCETDDPQGICIMRPVHLLDDHLLVQRIVPAGARITSTMQAIDLGTGDLAGQIGGWSPAIEFVEGSWLVGKQVPPLLEAGLGPAWLVQWRGDPPGFRVRGPIDADWCKPPDGRYLACLAAGTGDLEVWEIR